MAVDDAAGSPAVGSTQRVRDWRPRACLLLGVLAGLMSGFWSSQFTDNWLVAPVMDTGITLYFALCLLMMQRRMWIALPIVAVALLLPPIAGMVKYQYLFAAASFSDLFEVISLVRHYGAWFSAAFGALCIAVLAALFIWNFRRPSLRHLLLWIPAAMFWGLFLAKLCLPVSMASSLPGVPPLGRGLVSMPAPVVMGNWTAFLRSAIIYADRASMIARLKAETPPDFGFMDDKLLAPAKRNIYVVVLESFMDPLAIKGAVYQEDPLGPLFQSWRKDSHLLGQSPVFGNRSAEAEFEVLCGLPVTFEGAPVVFPQIQAPSLDCLPRKLAALGWKTDVRTIADPRLYNYGRIYPKLGFQDLHFADSIVTDDVDGLDVPSADAVFAAQTQHIDDLLAAKQPFMAYLFGTFGHLPYTLDTTKRPYKIGVDGPSTDLLAYVNNLHYTSLALARYVAHIRDRDPDAVIVAFGDHHPVLRDLPPNIDYPGPFTVSQDVPLLIIDGPRGFVPLRGHLPLYGIPGVVADLLTDGAFCRANNCVHQQPVSLRPLADTLLVNDKTDDKVIDCLATEGAPACSGAGAEAKRYQSALATILGDQ